MRTDTLGSQEECARIHRGAKENAHIRQEDNADVSEVALSNRKEARRVTTLAKQFCDVLESNILKETIDKSTANKSDYSSL